MIKGESDMMKKIVLAACATVLATTFTAPAIADDAGEIKYRQSVMKAVGGHMGAIAGILKSSTVNGANLQVHANGLAELSAIAPSVFPAGSDFGETTALPVIWEKPADFAAAMKKFQDAAAAMAVAAKTGDMGQVGAAMGPLGEACKNCHETFREKKQ